MRLSKCTRVAPRVADVMKIAGAWSFSLHALLSRPILTACSPAAISQMHSAQLTCTAFQCLAGHCASWQQAAQMRKTSAVDVKTMQP